MAINVPRISETRVKRTAGPRASLSVDAPIEAFGGGTQGVTSAGRELASAVQDLASREIQRANEIKVQDEISKLTEWRNEYLNNPKSGVLNRRGEDSFTTPDEYDVAFNEINQGLKDGLNNDSQRRAYSLESERIRVSAQDKINIHVSGQKTVYDRDTTEASLRNESVAAINNPNDGFIITESLANQEKTIKGFVDRNGLSPEVEKAMLFDSFSKTHIGVINNLISIDSDEALRYFKKNKSEINQEILNEAGLAKKIEAVHKVAIQGTVDGFEEKLIENTLTPQEVLNLSRPISEGGVGSKIARQYIDRIKKNQKAEISEILTLKTVQEAEDKKYINLVDKLIDDTVDNFVMKQVLVDAYIDGELTSPEKKKLNKIRTILKDVNLNKNSAPWNPFLGWFRESVKEIDALLDRSNFEDKDVSNALRRLIDYDINMDKNEDEMNEATQQIIKEEHIKKNPNEAKYKLGETYVAVGIEHIAVRRKDGSIGLLPKF